MKGSIQVAKMFDIPVKLHWSFGLFVVYVGYIGFSQGFDWIRIGTMILAALALFFCVVLHEYGHALTARKYGVSTRDIILSPIGGVARLERLPEKPIQEFYVAIAGPLVNIAIVVLITPIILFLFQDEIIWGTGFIRSIFDLMNFNSPFAFLPFLLVGNVILAGFNLVPAFPMDGGRIFRSLLSIKLGRLRATQIASFLGVAFGVLMIGVGIMGLFNSNIITSVIGLFVALMAIQEYRMVKMESILKSQSAGDIARTEYTKMYMDMTMETPIQLVKTGAEKSFLVFDREEKLMGVLHELFIREATLKNDSEGPVAEYLSINYEVIPSTLDLNELLKKMRSEGYSILPIYKEDQLLGVIDVDKMKRIINE